MTPRPLLPMLTQGGLRNARVCVDRYRTYSRYLRELFGERVQKIPLDAGFTCPNRDGTRSRGGCIYCDALGSGTGAYTQGGLSIEQQILQGKRYLGKRYSAKKFIAYFQSYSNTYGPIPKLKELYDRALGQEGMVGLSVATRPDCVTEAALKLLSGYRERWLVWVEYGLQSAHDETLRWIRRGHDVACFEQCVLSTARAGLNICAHVILGLPGESREMMLDTARYLASLPVHGVKIHLLYVLRGTPLAELFHRGEFRCLEREEYAELVVDFLERLPPGMVIQRLTGDPPPSGLIAPSWSRDKRTNLRVIQETLKRRDTRQGRRYLCGSPNLRRRN